MSARVMVVDDVPTNVKLMEAKLMAEYFDVITASSGEEALELVRSRDPDIILLDVMMPHMDGFEVCRRLKRDPNTAHIPVVMVTALDQPGDRVAGLECGADDFLTKPVQDMALFARIRSLVRLKTMSDELRMREATSAAFGNDSKPAGPIIETDAENGRIFLIEDRMRVVDQIEEALHNIATVTAIPEDFHPVHYLREHPCDMVMVSLSLADADGLRICSQIRSAAETRTLPILTIAEEAENARLVRALEIGVNDYILRPIDPNELVARSRTQIRRARYENRLRENLSDNLRLAVTDSLTALYNRHYMNSHLDKLIQRGRNTRPLSILMLDVDSFKSVNDRWGHATGDAVLVEVARRIQQNIRGVDLAARYGGEEIVIIMPETESVLAAHAAERLRRAIADEPITLSSESEPIAVTVSIGVATSGDGVESGLELVDRADSALYEAKRSGRNQVVAARSFRFGEVKSRKAANAGET